MESEKRCYEMLTLMAHRGLPGKEYQKVVKSGPFYIGHIRLPIIGLGEKQDQPMQDERMILAFNGEIYNYQGFDPKKQYKNDTEFLFHHLSVLEDEILDHLFSRVDGMYSIVYKHQKKDHCRIITDPLCKKPLYYDSDRNEIASELKALDTTYRQLNKQYMSNVAMFGYNMTLETPFKNIIKLPANSLMMLTPTSLSILNNSLVDLSPAPSATPASVCSALAIAIKNRLVADVPVGVLLSGGLDSSLVASIASDILTAKGQVLNTFSIENDETRYSDLMADYIGSNHTTLKIEPLSTNIHYWNEVPVDIGSVIPQYLLCQAVHKEGLKVCITGDGADELFGGYTRMSEYINPFMDTQYSDIFNELVYYHCPRLDKMSMAHTVELRSPFLATTMIRAALAIPYRERIRKSFLKRVARGIIPDEIIDRQKVPLRIDSMKKDRKTYQQEFIREYYTYIEGAGGLR